jgi:hypothetical protein
VSPDDDGAPAAWREAGWALALAAAAGACGLVARAFGAFSVASLAPLDDATAREVYAAGFAPVFLGAAALVARLLLAEASADDAAR